jgi:hypothetical protein
MKRSLLIAGVLIAASLGVALRAEAFYAPGGGGRSGAGLNKYSNLHCETLNGQDVPSTCNSDHMEKTSQNIIDNYVTALVSMGQQLTTVMMQSVFSIGTFIDAKQQLETQQLFQRLSAQAHKDYQPSEMMCQFGTFMRSVPEAEHKSDFNKQALNQILMTSYTNQMGRGGAEGYVTDLRERLKQFREVYCDPQDNSSGLSYMCEQDQSKTLKGKIGGQDKTRLNKDIDFVRTAGDPLTLDVDFTDAAKTADEEDIIALSRNLYWPQPFDAKTGEDMPNFKYQYLTARNLFAMQNVAHNSFVQIAAMKARSDVGLGAQSGWNYMKALMREFGLSDADIDKTLGTYPSYYAQMDVLTKKIYQSPDFYTNLYDKPANVKRISDTLEAIRVMQGRDMYESLLRQEMLSSMMVQEALGPSITRTNENLTNASVNLQ